MEWHEIKKYEGLYWINKNGDVKNKRGKIKSTFLTNGYKRVALYKNGLFNNYFIHRLVALNFLLGKQKETVNHIDLNKENNSVSNLEWCSLLDNIRHYKENNIIHRGVNIHTSKLKKIEVLEIRKTHPLLSYNALAKRYEVSKNTIADIITNRTWKHL